MRIPRSVLVLMTAAALNGCDAPLASDDAGAAYAADGGDAAVLVDPDAVHGNGGASTNVIDDIAITDALGAPPAPAPEGSSDGEGERGDAGEGDGGSEGDGEELETLDPRELQLWRDLFENGYCPTCGMG